MLAKLYYLTLGVAGLLVDAFNGLADIGEARMQGERRHRYQTIERRTFAAAVIGPVASATAVDDLTRIKGIGPAFALRLQEAGIGTFAAVAATSPQRLREITGAAPWQADPQAWIMQARVLAHDN